MELVAIVSVLTLMEYMAFGILVGRARGEHGVKAPAITGNPVFERYMRVHQNTLEQLVVFLPSMWLFGWYVHAPSAALLGLVFLVGRVIYLRGYVEEPSKRSTGVAITAVAQMVLLAGAGIGAVVAWL